MLLILLPVTLPVILILVTLALEKFERWALGEMLEHTETTLETSEKGEILPVSRPNSALSGAAKELRIDTSPDRVKSSGRLPKGTASRRRTAGLRHARHGGSPTVRQIELGGSEAAKAR